MTAAPEAPPAGDSNAGVDTSVPEPQKEKAKPRPYVVLRKIGPSTSPSQAQVWEFARNVEATSAEQAIRKVAAIIVAASEEKIESITLVAVTANRFQPKTVTSSTTTQLKLS
jgi:hypothetical protein